MDVDLHMKKVVFYGNKKHTNIEIPEKLGFKRELMKEIQERGK